MIDPAHYFIFGTLISLALITYSDFKTLKIDDRRNWFMQGYTLALAIMSNVLLIYVLFTFLMFGMNKVLAWWEKWGDQKILGDGDKKLLQWLVPGFVILGLIMPGIFFISLMLVLAGLVVLKHFKQDYERHSGVLYITIAFLLTWGLYLLF